MAKARSPQYPAIGLKEAIEKIAAIYGKDYQNHIPRAVAAKHMGYDTLHGKALSVLSALLKYGLLDGRGDESHVSDLAVTIIAHQPGSPERVEALKQAASNPELFAELDNRFNNGKGSDPAIRSYLLTQKFLPSAADVVVRSYRETKQLVEGESEGYSGSSMQETQPMNEPEADWGRVLGPQPPPGQRHELDDPDWPPPAGTRKTVFVVPEGDVTVTFPELMSASSAEDLEAYIKIWLRQIQREAAKPKNDEAAN